MQPELRYNILDGEWVLFSPKRGSSKKPRDFKNKFKRVISSKGKCPFENPQKSGNDKPYFYYPEDKPLEDWKVQVLPNKFPGMEPKAAMDIRHSPGNLFMSVKAHGYHDLLITRDHNKNISLLNEEELFFILKSLQKRYKQISLDKNIHYISMFQNWGPMAGATLYHPHFQIISLPIVPSRIKKSLEASRQYFKNTSHCLYCDIIRGEIRNKKRIVYLDSRVAAFVPFASQEPFKVAVFPKSHISYFEETSDNLLYDIAVSLKKIVGLIKNKVGDPDYNLFICTSPVYDKNKNGFFHWHIEIVPRVNISAGFELGAGIEINPVVSEEAAKLLRKR